MKYSFIFYLFFVYSQTSVGYTASRSKYYVDDNVIEKGAIYKNIRQSSPMRIFECMSKSSLLRCIKLFIWVKMEQFPLQSSTGNLTQDFMAQFLSREEVFPSLIDKRFEKVSENELTKKLVFHIRNFFQNRELKVKFLPGITFHFTPNMDNNLKMSISKEPDEQENSTDIEEVEEERGHRRKKKKDKTHSHKDYKHTVIQMAVPVLMMPAILLGTFLPFMLPALKMATIMSVIVNNAALIAALMHAARTHVMNQETEIVHYSPHGATY